MRTAVVAALGALGLARGALDPCTDARFGSADAVASLVRDHAWAAGIDVSPSGSCADALSTIQAKAPAWAAFLTAEQTVQDGVTGAFTAVPAWSLKTLAAQAAEDIQVARNATFGAALAPACTSGSCSPAQALATDALAGSLRLRDEPGWARVDGKRAAQPLSFPSDHSLHAGTSDEWLYFVVSGMARDAATGDVVPFSSLALLEYHLPGPETMAATEVAASGAMPVAGSVSAARTRLLDVRLGFTVGGTCPGHTTAGGVLYGPAAPVFVGQPAGEGPAFFAGVGAVADPLAAQRAARVEAADATLRHLTVTSHDARSGARANLTAVRAVASIMQRGPGGLGFMGATEQGNAYGYYSVPRFQVRGTVQAPGCNGTLRSLEVTSALGWLDHQWGTIALPYTAEQREAQALYVRLGGDVPLVDRGFGIVGPEMWFAFQLADGARGFPAELAGASLSSNLVSVGPWPSLAGIATHGRVAFANGSFAHYDGVINVTASTQCPAELAALGACDPAAPDPSRACYATGLVMEVPGLGLTAAEGSAIVVSAIKDDQIIHYASGQPFWEGGAVGRCSGCAATGPPDVFAFIEQINADPNATAAILRTAGGDPSLAHAAETEYNFANA